MKCELAGLIHFLHPSPERGERGMWSRAEHSSPRCPYQKVADLDMGSRPQACLLPPPPFYVTQGLEAKGPRPWFSAYGPTALPSLCPVSCMPKAHSQDQLEALWSQEKFWGRGGLQRPSNTVVLTHGLQPLWGSRMTLFTGVTHQISCILDIYNS